MRSPQWIYTVARILYTVYYSDMEYESFLIAAFIRTFDEDAVADKHVKIQEQRNRGIKLQRANEQREESLMQMCPRSLMEHRYRGLRLFLLGVNIHDPTGTVAAGLLNCGICMGFIDHRCWGCSPMEGCQSGERSRVGKVELVVVESTSQLLYSVFLLPVAVHKGQQREQPSKRASVVLSSLLFHLIETKGGRKRTEEILASNCRRAAICPISKAEC